MTNHKFKIGQMVDFSPPRFEAPAAHSGYTIVRQMPKEAGENHYRIKSAADVNERVAKERDLKLRSDR